MIISLHMDKINRTIECRHATYIYNSNDLVIGGILSRYGEWAEPEVAIYRKYISKGDVVLDVGANIGYFSVIFSQLVEMDGLVFTFEPIRINHQLLCANAAINDCFNIIPFHMALGKSAGTIITPHLNGLAKGNYGSISLKELNLIDGENVRLAAIDDFLLPKCHFIKIDVEGMEGDVILGAKDTIAKNLPVIYFEQWEESIDPEIRTQLESLGYSLYRHSYSTYNADNFFKSEPGPLSADLVSSENILALPPNRDTSGLDGLVAA